MGSHITMSQVRENPAWWAAYLQQTERAAGRGGEHPKDTPVAAHTPGQMNKTEARYARMLDGMKERGEILDYLFERFTIKLSNPQGGQGRRYTPDFLVILPDRLIRFDEVKGGFIREDAAIKFDWACEQFPHIGFRMTQWKDGEWKVLKEHLPAAIPPGRGAPAGAGMEPPAPPVSRPPKKGKKPC
jgi:hypothetical protein